MLKIDRSRRSFVQLETPSLAAAAVSERYDLQEYISNSPEAFFGELGQDLFLIGKEVPLSTTVPDRLDLLVSGPPKPARDGRVKTSYLRQRRNCHAPFSSPLAKGATTWQTYSKWLQSLTTLL